MGPETEGHQSRNEDKGIEGIVSVTDNTRNAPYRQSEIPDVELLDVFAEIEAMLRCGREVQREALRSRGLPHPVSALQRLEASRSIRNHLIDMMDQCRGLGDVLSELQETAAQLEKLVEAETPTPRT